MNQPNGGWGPPQPGQQWGQPAAPPAQAPQQQAPQQQAPQQMPQQQPPPGMPMPGQQMPQAPQGFANGGAFQQQQPQMPPQQMPGQFAPQQFQNDPFAGLTSGSQENRFPFLNAGHHRLRIDKTFLKNTRKGKSFFAMELTVLATNSTRHPVSSQATVFIDLGNEDMRGRHLSRIVCSVYGFDPNGLPKDTPVAPWPDQQTGQQMPWAHYLAQAVSDANPWAGAEIGTYSKNTVTQKQNVFTIHHWRPANITEIPTTAADESPENKDDGAQQQGGYPQGQQGYTPPQQGYPQQGQQWHQGGHSAPQQPSPGVPPQGTPPAQPGAASPPWGGPPPQGVPPGRGY